MHTLEHPLMGHLEWSGTRPTGGWSGTIILPSFVECYEKWCVDGTEFFRDRRTENHRQGRFDLTVLASGPGIDFGRGKEMDELREPSAPQCAAYAALAEDHAALADSLKEELEKYVRDRNRDWCGLADEEFELLLRPERILGTLELEGVCITYHFRSGFALVGLTFHSEIWDCEHGLGAVVHRNKVIRLGAAEDAWPESMRVDP